MVAVARETVPAGVGIRLAEAEQLPFRDGWFDRVTMSLVLHLVDRPRALAEARRVVPDGRTVAISTFHPDHFASYWLNPFFPSIRAIDEARFPTPEEIERELAAAGFPQFASRRLSGTAELGRDEALARIRGRHISTFDLLAAEEIAEGTARAERELPDRIVVAARAARRGQGRRPDRAARRPQPSTLCPDPLNRHREAGKENVTTHIRRPRGQGPARRRGSRADALPHRARADRAQRRSRRARARRHPHARRPARPPPAGARRRAVRRRRRPRRRRHHLPPRRRARPRRRPAAARPAGRPRARSSTSRSRARPSCSSTTCSSPAARSAPRSTPCSSTAGRRACSSRCSSTAATASCRSAPTTSARTSPRRSPSASGSSSPRPTRATASCSLGGDSR